MVKISSLWKHLPNKELENKLNCTLLASEIRVWKFRLKMSSIKRFFVFRMSVLHKWEVVTNIFRGKKTLTFVTPIFFEMCLCSIWVLVNLY